MRLESNPNPFNTKSTERKENQTNLEHSKLRQNKAKHTQTQILVATRSGKLIIITSNWRHKKLSNNNKYQYVILTCLLAIDCYKIPCVYACVTP